MSKVSKIKSSQPPPYTPDKRLEYMIRYVPTAADYLWQISLGSQVPFALSTGSSTVRAICKYVRLKSVRMTLLYDPDEALSSNFISLRWEGTSGQNGILGDEKVAYASQLQPGVIECSLSMFDPRGYFYDTDDGNIGPTLVMQTRRNCFVDLVWEFVLYDGLCKEYTSSGLTASYLYTNKFSTDITCPGRVSAVWF